MLYVISALLGSIVVLLFRIFSKLCEIKGLLSIHDDNVSLVYYEVDS